jgi:hypothetical protein
MINNRSLGMILVIVSLFGCFWVGFVPDASAQPPPYPPLNPSMFKVTKTSWATSNSTYTATPGDSNIPLYVSIQNIGNRTATGLSETLLLKPPFTNASGGSTVSAYSGNNMDPGLAATTNFILNIARDAKVGMHTLTMRIDYLQIVSGTGTTLYLQQQTDVEVPVLVSSTPYLVMYSITVFPSQASPGGNLSVSGTAVDLSSLVMSNTNISISSPAFVKGGFVYVGESDPNIPRPFSFSVQVRRDVQNGTFPAVITIAYSDSYNVNHVNSVTISIQVTRRAAPTIIRPAEKGPIEIILDALWGVIRFFFGSQVRTMISQTTLEM